MAENPKDSVGKAKAPIHHVPLNVMTLVGLAMMEGARKYGSHNYREASVEAGVYIDALWRHISDWWEGRSVDPDSRLSHLVKAIATLVVLADAEMQGNMIDDRPPPSREGWQDEANKMAAAIVAKYPTSKPPHIKANI